MNIVRSLAVILACSTFGCAGNGPSSETVDATTPDAAVADATTADATSIDAAAADAGSMDATTADARTADATTADAASIDATTRDASTLDGSVHDAARDATMVHCSLPHTYVVKYTDAAYASKVLIRTSSDYASVTAYPGPTDVRCEAPVALDADYFVGDWVGANVVATDYDRCDYHDFTDVPSLDTLLAHVIDNHPFAEIWDCGCGPRETSVLNDIIMRGALDAECTGP